MWLAVLTGDPVPPSWPVMMQMQEDGPVLIVENAEGC